MKKHRVFLWVLLLLPLLVCFESSAHAQEPPRIRPSTTPTCTVDIKIYDNKQEYNTRIGLYREDGTPVMKVPRFISTTRYKLMFLVVGNYVVKLSGRYPAADGGGSLAFDPSQQPVTCRLKQTPSIWFKIKSR